MTIKGFGINLSSALTQTAADGTSYADLVSGYWDLNLNYGSSGNQNAGNTHVSLSGSTISYQVGTGDEVWAILEGKGRDTSIAPDIAEAPSGYLMKKGANAALFLYKMESTYTAGTKTFTVEDASSSITESAYVAPASMSGTGPVVFK